MPRDGEVTRNRRGGSANGNGHGSPSLEDPRLWQRYAQCFIGLGCVLAFPPTRTLACWLSMGGGPFLLVGGDATVREGLRTTWSSLRGRDPLELERTMRAVYDDLFRGDPPAIDLVESRFRLATPTLEPRFSQAAASRRLDALLTAYDAAAFTVPKYASAPDHLSVELHFLGRQLEQCGDAGEVGRRARTRAESFAREHVVSWLPALRQTTARRRDHGFYLSTLILAEADGRAVVRDLERLTAQPA